MKAMIAFLVLGLGGLAQAKGYSGPARPQLPADAKAIRIDPDACRKDAAEAIGLDAGDAGAKEQLETAGKELCELRAKHQAARDHLLKRLADMVAALKDATNHDHAQRLPATIKAIQAVVKSCLDALASQQYCHNLGCAEEPESNAILCETKAAEILDTIVP